MTDENSKRVYYPALDGLRGIAILLVVLLHNFKSSNFFFFGWLGVDLFFVLSGFLITDILLKNVSGKHYLRNFYARRFLRIFPVYYLALIICLLILPRMPALNLNADYYTQHQFWLWTYLQNWLFIYREPVGDQLLLHTWSLAVEEQFYLLWPLIILLVRKPRALFWIATAGLLLTGATRYILWSLQFENFAYGNFFTFTRIDGLCIGSMLSLLMITYPNFLKKYTTLIVFLVAGINIGFYFINDGEYFSLPYLAFVGYTTFTFLFGLLVHEAVTGESRIIHWILNFRPLKFFGRISYGLYVYHWPVYLLLFPFFRNALQNAISVSEKMADTLSAVVVTTIAVIISVASYRFIEKPLLKFKNRFS